MNFVKKIDFFLLIPVTGLVGIGLSLIASTTPNLFVQQLIFILIGLILFFAFSVIDFRIWPKFVWIFIFLTLGLLIITFLGQEVRGSSRWIDLGWFRMQPSELIKPIFIIVIASLFAQSRGNTWRMLGKPLFYFIPILILIFKQPDLGNVIVYLVIFATITVMSGISWRILLIGISLVTGLIPISWFFLRQYQRLRILSFLDPTADPIGTGYNALQAIIAIGSGQIAGLGLGRGTQSHLLFLPEYHTDFVFASIGEELGFIGGSLVIIFYAVLLSRILYIAYGSRTDFTRLLSVGIFAQIFIQVAINIGMNLGILPITGITLPLLSYGGSSVISTFVVLGFIANISKSEKTQSPIVIK